jgi:ribulose bisphosphate carboxylase small subunit
MGETKTFIIHTSLKGLKRHAWRKNLSGFFTHRGRELSDSEVRKLVEYGIKKGYETEAEFTDEEVDRLLSGKTEQEKQLTLF